MCFFDLVREIQEDFNATEHMICITEDMVQKGLILCMPHRRRGKVQLEATVNLVMEVYESDEAVMCPGRRILEKSKKCKRN
jgi:hypothetical protein